MTESTRTLNITPEEIQQGKTMAIVSYLIFFIPLLMDDMRKNKFVMFHTEQSIVLLLIKYCGRNYRHNYMRDRSGSLYSMAYIIDHGNNECIKRRSKAIAGGRSMGRKIQPRKIVK